MSQGTIFMDISYPTQNDVCDVTFNMTITKWELHLK